MIFIRISVYFTFIIITAGTVCPITVSFNENPLTSCTLHHHFLDHLLHLRLCPRSFSLSILPRCLAVLGQMSFLVAILTAKILLWSSVKACLGLGLL